MKKELQEQKHRVRSMKGNDIPPVTKTHDSGTKSKTLLTELGAFMRTEFLCISALRVWWHITDI